MEPNERNQTEQRYRLDRRIWSAIGNLGTLGLDSQRTLFSSRNVIVGLGGLGGHVQEQMARAGVGHITGIDTDVFEPVRGLGQSQPLPFRRKETTPGQEAAQNLSLKVSQMDYSKI